MTPRELPQYHETDAISFPEWRNALELAELSRETKAQLFREIVSFLRYCKTCHAPASVMLAKRYLERFEGPKASLAREALRWFVRHGRSAEKPARSPSGDHNR